MMRRERTWSCPVIDLLEQVWPHSRCPSCQACSQGSKGWYPEGCLKEMLKVTTLNPQTRLYLALPSRIKSFDT
jgi:hypothetical protein